MLRRYWSKQWQVKYKKYYDAPPNKTRKEKNKSSIQMVRWQKKLIHTIWVSMIKLWKMRNDKRHGWDKETVRCFTRNWK
jgi:hypothetical protein